MNKGCLYTSLSAVIFGLLPLITKIIMQGSATSLTVVFYRVFFVTLILFVFLKIRNIDLSVKRKELPALMSIAVFGSGLTMILLNESYTFVDTGIATSLHFLYPLFVALLCFLLYGDTLTRMQGVSMILALVGIVCFMAKGGGDGIGYVIAILSGLTYAFYLVLMDKTNLVQMNPYKLSFYLALFTTIEILVVNLFSKDIRFILDVRSYVLLGILAIAASLIATVLLQKGVLLLGSSRASFICLLEPVTAMVTGVLFLDEAVSFSKMAGSLFIVVALLIFLQKDPEKKAEDS